MMNIDSKWREKEMEDGFRWTQTEGATTQKMLHRIYKRPTLKTIRCNIMLTNQTNK